MSLKGITGNDDDDDEYIIYFVVRVGWLIIYLCKGIYSLAQIK